MTAFVIVYDRRRLFAEITEYAGDEGVARAGADRARREAANADQNVEVVTVFADTLDDLRTTHSRYFFNQPKLIQPAS